MSKSPLAESPPNRRPMPGCQPGADLKLLMRLSRTHVRVSGQTKSTHCNRPGASLSATALRAQRSMSCRPHENGDVFPGGSCTVVGKSAEPLWGTKRRGRLEPSESARRIFCPYELNKSGTRRLCWRHTRPQPESAAPTGDRARTACLLDTSSRTRLLLCVLRRQFPLLR